MAAFAVSLAAVTAALAAAFAVSLAAVTAAFAAAFAVFLASVTAVVRGLEAEAIASSKLLVFSSAFFTGSTESLIMPIISVAFLATSFTLSTASLKVSTTPMGEFFATFSTASIAPSATFVTKEATGS